MVTEAFMVMHQFVALVNVVQVHAVTPIIKEVDV